jgi:hypothetical protein
VQLQLPGRSQSGSGNRGASRASHRDLRHWVAAAQLVTWIAMLTECHFDGGFRIGFLFMASPTIRGESVPADDPSITF